MNALNTILFYFFSALAVGSALVMITRRNVVHAGIFLATTLLSTGGIFLLLRAELVFGLQIFLYAGATVILFIFVLALASPAQIATSRRPGFWGAALALVLAAQILFATLVGGTSLRLPAMQAAIDSKNSAAVGTALFHQYLVPFEIASVLLLTSMIGAVMMARRRS